MDEVLTSNEGSEINDGDSSISHEVSEINDGVSSISNEVSEINDGDSSTVTHKFTRLKKSHRKRYKWLLSHGYSTEESLKLCKTAVLYENKLSVEEQTALPQTPRTSDSTKIVKKTGKGQKRKKSCVSHLLVGAIKVGILPTDYPDILITGEEQKMLEDKLVKQILLCTDRPGPSFYKISYRPSYIVLYCENEATAKWVKEQENKLQILGIDIVVRNQDAFPPLRLVMGNFKIQNFSLNEIRSIIAKQNAVNAKVWKILHAGCVITEKLSKIIFSIDEASFKYLEKKQYLLSFLLGQVKLRHIKLKERKRELITEEISDEDFLNQFLSEAEFDAASSNTETSLAYSLFAL